jgi:hypothetical protein
MKKFGLGIMQFTLANFFNKMSLFQNRFRVVNKASFLTTAPYPSIPCRFAGTIRLLPPMGAGEFVAPQ